MMARAQSFSRSGRARSARRRRTPNWGLIIGLIWCAVFWLAWLEFALHGGIG